MENEKNEMMTDTSSERNYMEEYGLVMQDVDVPEQKAPGYGDLIHRLSILVLNGLAVVGGIVSVILILFGALRAFDMDFSVFNIAAFASAKGLGWNYKVVGWLMYVVWACIIICEIVLILSVTRSIVGKAGEGRVRSTVAMQAGETIDDVARNVRHG